MNAPWLDQLLQKTQSLLGAIGVAEASRPVGALILLYVCATLISLLFVFVVWRISRRKSGLSVNETTAPEKSGEPVVQEEKRPDDSIAIGMDPEAEAVVAPEVTVLERMRSGLGKTRDSLVGRLDGLFGSQSRFSPEMIEELEEILITSDFGMPTTQALVRALEERFSGSDAPSSEIYAGLKEEISLRLRLVAVPDREIAAGPKVIMMVGVNGVGKTTTIGKLASRYAADGKKVLLGAGDTFRAAAAEQLEVWARRAGVDIVRHQEGGDPAAVAFDAVKAAIARKSDLLIIDTAGRLHTKANLMEELKKVCRVLGRELAGAPHQTLLVVDATTGQNALAQARLFKEAVDVDGIVLTKLDGTAKGGIVVAISNDLKIPVRYIGIGEAIDDLRPFDPDLFAAALFDGSDGA
ncbi:MAG: signal recognition particle-docking protein FtsY [Desulfuromonas sp.]|nr:MAG: signal recognition particle-docking protein FtsY [Desulfuromonas sp.]